MLESNTFFLEIYKDFEEAFINILTTMLFFSPDLSDLEARPATKHRQKNAPIKLTPEILRAFGSLREFYKMKIAINGGRLAPLEKSVWNRVQSMMAPELQKLN